MGARQRSRDAWGGGGGRGGDGDLGGGFVAGKRHRHRSCPRASALVAAAVAEGADSSEEKQQQEEEEDDEEVDVVVSGRGWNQRTSTSFFSRRAQAIIGITFFCFVNPVGGCVGGGMLRCSAELLDTAAATIFFSLNSTAAVLLPLVPRVITT